MVRRYPRILTLLIGALVVAACGNPQPPATKYELDVTLGGTGTGTVTSAPAGIDCGTDCDAEFTEDAEVTLTATAAAGSTFDGWGGACSGTAATCDLTMDAAKSVTATFTLDTPVGDAVVTVDVIVAGTADGAITSSPAGIDADTLTAEFPIGSTVELTVTVDEGAFFGWSGGVCEGVRTLTCTITVAESLPTFTALLNDLSTLNLAIAANADDSEEFLADSFDDRNTDGRWDTGFSRASSSDLELAFDPDHAPQAIGLRFQGVTVPAGATIVQAVLGFTAFESPDTGSLGTVALTIQGQATDLPPAFVTDPNDTSPRSFDITDRTPTTASVAWSITEEWVAEQAYQSPNAAAVLQEIVDLADWTSSNPVVFLLTGELASTEYRRAYAHDADPAKAATLAVQYVADPRP